MVSNVKKLSDRQLIVGIKTTNNKELQEKLWKRYENLVHKNWFILQKQMNNSPLISEMHDDFYSESYIAFQKAIEAIDLNKIYNDKWKFLGYFKFYLKNVRSDIIREVSRLYQHEKPLFVKNKNNNAEIIVTDITQRTIDYSSKFNPAVIIEKNEAEERCSAAIAACMKSWDKRRQQIFTWRQQGISKSDIAKKLGIHPASITYHLRKMKKDLLNYLQAP